VVAVPSGLGTWKTLQLGGFEDANAAETEESRFGNDDAGPAQNQVAVFGVARKA